MPLAWRPADFTDTGEWTTTLSDAERDEIVTATRAAAGAGLTAATVRAESFPLPGLTARLADWVRELSAGEAYTDHDDPAERRHLLRLWLTAHAFASVEDTLRHGIPARQDS